MKLEYLSDLTDSGRYTRVVSEKLVRLYHFGKEEAGKFRDALIKEVINGGKHLNLSDLYFIDQVNCNLILRLSAEETGLHTRDEQTLYCDLSVQNYRYMVDMIDPFCEKESGGFQWLSEEGDIDFLFSPSGDW